MATTLVIVIVITAKATTIGIAMGIVRAMFNVCSYTYSKYL